MTGDSKGVAFVMPGLQITEADHEVVQFCIQIKATPHLSKFFQSFQEVENVILLEYTL